MQYFHAYQPQRRMRQLEKFSQRLQKAVLGHAPAARLQHLMRQCGRLLRHGAGWRATAAAAALGLALGTPQEAFSQTFGPSSANPFGLASVGYQASPSLVDIDGDGDLDALICHSFGNIFYFQNTGTSSGPAFASPQQNPFGLADMGFNTAMAWADLDGDGDLDALISEDYGTTYYFENTGSSSSPAFTNRGGNPFGLSDLGDYPSPELADIDGDGDYDLFLGVTNGTTYYFANTGSSSAPAFQAAVSLPFGISDPGERAVPDLVDWDGDGDYDLFLGDLNNGITYFENTGTSNSPAFGNSSLNPFGLADLGLSHAPDLVDIDGDGDWDAFVGIFSPGNTVYFEGEGPSCAPTEAASSASFGSVTAASIELAGFTAPSGGADGYVVKCNTSDSFTAPADGSLPSANTAYGGGEQVVYAGAGIPSGLAVTGLSGSTAYFFRIYAYNDCSGTITYETSGLGASRSTLSDAIQYVNLQWPPALTVGEGSPGAPIYGRLYVAGLTDNTSGQAPGVEAWVGFSSTNTDPSTWSEGDWQAASFNVETGNDDEYHLTTSGSTLSEGTYFYATRFRLNGGAFRYGGFNADSGDGFWDGTNDVSGTLTVAPRPSVSIATSAGSTVSGPFTITIAFSEDVSGLLPNELAISNATYSGAAILSASEYALTLQPRRGGNVEVSLPLGMASSVANAGTNAASNTLTVYFDGLVEACVPGAGNASEDWIQRVEIGQGASSLLDNASGNNGGYANFDNLGAVQLVQGDTYSTRITPGRSAPTNMESYRIWIDYNRDGDFLDAEDLAFARFLTNNSRVQGSFTVPGNALTGLARMRVQVKRDAVPFSPCETLPQGETEDYLVRIMAPELLGQRIASPAGSAEAVDAMAVYPNPAGPRAFLLLPPSQGPAAIEVFGLDGRRVLQGRSEDGRCALDLSGLPAGWYMATATFEASGLRQSVKFVVE